MSVSNQLFNPGFDPTGLDSISTDQLLQMIAAITAFVDKGLVITTTDVAGVAQPPDPADNADWSRYLWRRITPTGSSILYTWDTSVSPDATLLNWVSVTVSNVGVNSVGTTQLQANAVTTEKVNSIDWTKIINFPSTMGGDLTGDYPNPTVKANAITSSKVAGGTLLLANMAQEVINAIQGNSTPSGIVTAFAGSAAPAGWLLCDGSAVSQATYPLLYAAISVVYASGIQWGYPCNADGSQNAGGTYFKLPDYRGYFLRGNGGVDAGRTLRTLQNDSYLAHSHPNTVSTTITKAIIAGASNASLATTGSGTAVGTAGLISITNANDTGGGTETRPKNMSVNYIIKT